MGNSKYATEMLLMLLSIQLTIVGVGIENGSLFILAGQAITAIVVASFVGKWLLRTL